MPLYVTTVRSIIRGLLIFLFVYAGFSKMLDFRLFIIQLGESPLVGPISHLVAWVVPLSEFLTALALVYRRTEIYGLYASLFLMTLLTGYVYYLLYQAYYIPCSCGGLLSMLSWNQHLWLNAGFLLLSAIGILVRPLAQTTRAGKARPALDNA